MSGSRSLYFFERCVWRQECRLVYVGSNPCGYVIQLEKIFRRHKIILVSGGRFWYNKTRYRPWWLYYRLFSCCFGRLAGKGLFRFYLSKVFALSRFRACHWRSLLGTLSANPVPKVPAVGSLAWCSRADLPVRILSAFSSPLLCMIPALSDACSLRCVSWKQYAAPVRPPARSVPCWLTGYADCLHTKGCTENRSYSIRSRQNRALICLSVCISYSIFYLICYIMGCNFYTGVV